jgi:hypothetical protein
MPRVPARHGNLTWTHRQRGRTEESKTNRARRRHPAAHPPIRVPAGLRARALCRPEGRTGGSPSRTKSQWLHDTPCAHLPLRGQHRHCGLYEAGPRTCFPFNPGRESPAGTDNALPLPGQWGRMIPYGAVSCTAIREGSAPCRRAPLAQGERRRRGKARGFRRACMRGGAPIAVRGCRRSYMEGWGGRNAVRGCRRSYMGGRHRGLAAGAAEAANFCARPTPDASTTAHAGHTRPAPAGDRTTP